VMANHATFGRRAAVRLLLSSMALPLLAACTPGAPSAPTQPPAPPAAPATSVAVATPVSAAAAPTAPPQPKSGGILRMGLTVDPSSLDGHLTSPAVFDTVWMAYDTLTRYDDQLKPQPVLAESWDLSTDGTQLKLNLRKGVQFHNGREFTSDDVKWNVLRVRDPKVGVAQLLNQSKWFTDIQTPDKYTVVLRSDAARPAVFDFTEFLNMLDQATMEGPDATTKPMGTGPFKFVEYVQADHLMFVRNPNYWQRGRPYLDGVRVTIAGDPQTLVTQLEGGALDAVDNPSVRDTVRLRRDPNWQVATNPVSGFYYLAMVNTTVPPFDNKLVRQALSFAVDRQRFTSTTLGGVFEPRGLPWPKHAPAYDAAKSAARGFDLDKARALLAQAGVSNFDLEINYQSANAETSGLAQIIQPDLEKIGAKVALRGLEDLTWRDQNQKVAYKGLSLALGGLAGIESSSLFTNSSFWNPLTGSTGFRSERYVQLLNAVTSEPDSSKRRDLYNQLNDFLLDESFVISVSGTAPIAALRPSVRGLKHTVHEAILYTDVWLA
jgi:peptide/nickel transport system substrate-binding protein